MSDRKPAEEPLGKVDGSNTGVSPAQSINRDASLEMYYQLGMGGTYHSNSGFNSATPQHPPLQPAFIPVGDFAGASKDVSAFQAGSSVGAPTTYPAGEFQPPSYGANLFAQGSGSGITPEQYRSLMPGTGPGTFPLPGSSAYGHPGNLGSLDNFAFGQNAQQMDPQYRATAQNQAAPGSFGYGYPQNMAYGAPAFSSGPREYANPGNRIAEHPVLGTHAAGGAQVMAPPSDPPLGTARDVSRLVFPKSLINTGNVDITFGYYDSATQDWITFGPNSPNETPIIILGNPRIRIEGLITVAMKIEDMESSGFRFRTLRAHLKGVHEDGSGHMFDVAVHKEEKDALLSQETNHYTFLGFDSENRAVIRAEMSLNMTLPPCVSRLPVIYVEPMELCSSSRTKKALHGLKDWEVTPNFPGCSFFLQVPWGVANPEKPSSRANSWLEGHAKTVLKDVWKQGVPGHSSWRARTMQCMFTNCGAEFPDQRFDGWSKLFNHIKSDFKVAQTQGRIWEGQRR